MNRISLAAVSFAGSFFLFVIGFFLSKLGESAPPMLDFSGVEHFGVKMMTLGVVVFIIALLVVIGNALWNGRNRRYY